MGRGHRKNFRKSGVYKLVHEHFEKIFSKRLSINRGYARGLMSCENHNNETSVSHNAQLRLLRASHSRAFGALSLARICFDFMQSVSSIPVSTSTTQHPSLFLTFLIIKTYDCRMDLK